MAIIDETLSGNALPTEKLHSFAEFFLRFWICLINVWKAAQQRVLRHAPTSQGDAPNTAGDREDQSNATQQAVLQLPRPNGNGVEIQKFDHVWLYRRRDAGPGIEHSAIVRFNELDFPCCAIVELGGVRLRSREEIEEIARDVHAQENGERDIANFRWLRIAAPEHEIEKPEGFRVSTFFMLSKPDLKPTALWMNFGLIPPAPLIGRIAPAVKALREFRRARN